MFLESLKRLDGLLRVVRRVLRLMVPEEFPEAALEVLSPPTGKRGDRLADAGAHEREDEVNEKEAERNVECRKIHGSGGHCYCQPFAEGVLVFAHLWRLEEPPRRLFAPAIQRLGSVR